MKRLAIFMALAAGALAAADVCPPGGATLQGTQPGSLHWQSAAHSLAKEHVCLSNSVRNLSGSPLELRWEEAGIERAWVRDSLEVAVCCFEGERTDGAVLAYGAPPREVQIRMHLEPAEGSEDREEGYPDLIEADARVRTMGIRGTLAAGGRPVRVDVALKCSASRFANQYAFQFSIVDRSPDPITVDWDLLRKLQASIRPSIQPIPGGNTYIFLSEREPEEADGLVEIRTKTGELAGRFKVDGFSLGEADR
jgi:hypothetical protein